MKEKILALILSLVMLVNFFPASMLTVSAEDVSELTEVTVDFTGEGNIAYGKTITPKAGRDYYAASSTTPSATSQLATDGDIATWHMAAGKDKLTWGNHVGCEFSMDLGGKSTISSIDLYVQVEGIYTSANNTGNLRTFANETINIYGGADSTTGTLIGTMTIPTASTSVTADGKTMDMYVYHIDFPANTEYSTITFENGTKYNWAYNEIYVNGTAVVDDDTTPDYAVLVAEDKAALDIGDTSAVISNLTLPTVGSVNGSIISWATSDESVITNTGVITRGDEDKTVTLTAIITNGDASAEKTFAVTVVKAEPTSKIVDFTEATNFAYGKTVTPKSGKDKYVSGFAPSATQQWATDGDIETYHMATGRKNGSWGELVGSEFSIDIGGNRVITSVDLYVQPKMLGYGSERSNSNLTINVYGGNDSETGTPIGTMTVPGDITAVTAGGKTMDMYIYHIDFPAGAEYSAITFENSAWYFGYNEIYINAEMTAEDYIAIVAADKAALDLGNTSSVISNLTLPETGAKGSTITWATDAPNVVATDGTVVRGSENQTATLTATITKGTAADTKTFVVTVLGTDTDDGKVAGDKAALDLGDTSAVTENLTLPMTGANGSTITWRTTNPAVVQADGTVHRGLDTKSATLTATITNGSASDTKQFTVTVLGTETAEEKVESDKETLNLGDITAVRANLTLPETGAKGTTITWETSDATVITENGVVTRGDADTTVTLTATIKYGDVTDTKVFTVTVLKKVVVSGLVDFDAAENVAYGKIATPVDGRHYYANSSVAPDETNKFTTDGDLTTYHQAAGRTGVFYGTKVGSEFTIDLAKTYTIEYADLFAQPIMNDGSTDRSNANIAIYVYGDGNKDTGTLVGKMTVSAEPTTISDGKNEMEVYVYHIDFPANSNYSTLSFYADITYYWGWNEVYVKGDTSFAASVIDDKKALELGDLNDVVENLTLPQTGAKGSTITWTTTDASVIETDGTVHRAEHTKKAKLTATITKGDVSDTKEFYVTVLGAYNNHYVINSDDFRDANNLRYKYVLKEATDSTVAVNEETQKLVMTRSSDGELSMKKFFVTEHPDIPYSVIGDKVAVEQLMALRDGLQGATAEIRNKNDELIATYGIKKEGADYVFFLNVGGNEHSILYAYGDEIFTRVELITEDGASSVKASVGTETGVTTVATLPLAASVHPSMTTVKYAANEGSNGKLILDGIKFMVEGTEHDAIKVELDYENLSVKDITTQNPELITDSLTLSPLSRWGNTLIYSSSDQSVVSDEGFVTRPTEDTAVTLSVTVRNGNISKTKEFNLIVKGADSDNLAIGNLVLSSVEVAGTRNKYAIDGVDETEFITAAEGAYLTICFDEATTFNKLIIKESAIEGSYSVTEFTIEVSDDGYSWYSVYTDTIIGEKMTAEFETVTTKYVRYSVKSCSNELTGVRDISVLYDIDYAAAIERDCEILYIHNNGPEITGDLKLPTAGEYGSKITWESSHPDIISDAGMLIKIPTTSTVVVLTAILTNGDQIRKMTFSFIVRGHSENTGGSGGSGGGGGGGYGCIIKGVSLNKTSIDLAVGESETLSTIIIPANTTNNDVYWKSSNTDVATVLDGVVMAKTVGTTTVTATTIDGGYTANCIVNVTEKVIAEGTPKITISNASAITGNEIEVTVDLSNNTGFANLGVEVGYNPEIMTLTNVVSNPAVGGVFTPGPRYTMNPFNLTWNSAGNITYNGNLATLTFIVDKNALEGIYPITVDYYKGVNGNYIDGESINYDENFNAVEFEYVSGEVMVVAPKITVTGTRTLPGKEIEVTVDLAENTGFSNLSIELCYDSDVMTLTEVVPNASIGATFTPAQNYIVNPYNMSWDSITNVAYNGNLATLRFSVKEDAADGIYPITVDYYKGVEGDYVDGESINYDENFDAVGFEYVSCNVIVRNYTPGDISGDEYVDSKDATLLLRYVAGWYDLDVVEAALDIDGSGKVDNKDITILLRYLAGWNVTLY